MNDKFTYLDSIELDKTDNEQAHLYFETDGVPSGVKDRLPSKASRVSMLEWHNNARHVGFMKDCIVCRMSRGSFNRVYSKVDPGCDIRLGYSWHMDVITWNI